MAGLKPYIAAVDPVSADERLSSFAAALMEHGGLAVVASKRLQGLLHADNIADREHPPQAHARSMLSPPAHVDDATTPAAAAAHLLAERVRALPVLIGGTYEGLVTERTLLALPEFQSIRRPVFDIASPEPYTVTSDDAVAHARAIMRAERIGRLPIVEEERLVGLLEWPHLIQLAAHRQNKEERSFREPVPWGRLPVTVAMDTDPLTVAGEETVAEVARRMREKERTAAVVVDDGRPIGIVTCEDLLELVADRGATDSIWVQATGLNGLDPFDRQIVERHLQEALTRLARMVRSPEYLYVHVKTYHERGQRQKYSIRARLADGKDTINARSHGYDLMEAVDIAMDRLERVARESHEKRVDLARSTSPRYAERSEERA
jgi:CBS domain-containing protein/ribosome-associated translation inhibitor RaiA